MVGLSEALDGAVAQARPWSGRPRPAPRIGPITPYLQISALIALTLTRHELGL